MPTTIRYVGDLPVEGPKLDGEATKRQKEVADFVLAAYAETGTLTGVKVCEAVSRFEQYALGHVEKD